MEKNRFIFGSVQPVENTIIKVTHAILIERDIVKTTWQYLYTNSHIPLQSLLHLNHKVTSVFRSYNLSTCFSDLQDQINVIPHHACKKVKNSVHGCNLKKELSFTGATDKLQRNLKAIFSKKVYERFPVLENWKRREISMPQEIPYFCFFLEYQ